MASSEKKAGSRALTARPAGKAKAPAKAAPQPKKAAPKPKKAAPKPKKAAPKPKKAAPQPKKAAPKPKKAAPKPKKAAPQPKKAAPQPKKAAPARAARRRPVAAAEDAPHAIPGLSEEDQIRAAKFLPREMPKRAFEEERFLFPETYGVNRVRLLVRDPEWIFAYWDVNPAAMKDLEKAIGSRTLALSRLTLRVLDPVSGGSSDILLPPGARWWYVRTDSARRTYRAELGVTLPSGEFRRLADSNTVVTPRVGPSAERARRRMSYGDARELPPSAARDAGEAERASGIARRPWSARSLEGAASPGEGGAARGGASDVFRPGGASDTFRR